MKFNAGRIDTADRAIFSSTDLFKTNFYKQELLLMRKNVDVNNYNIIFHNILIIKK